MAILITNYSCIVHFQMAGSQFLWDVLLDIPGASFVAHGRQLSRDKTRWRAWYVVLAVILRSKVGLEYEDIMKF